MDILLAGVASVIGALTGGISTYLTFRQQTKADANKTRIDLLKIVDERTNAFIERLEEQLAEKNGQIARLEALVVQLRGLVYMLLGELRKHDTEAADRIGAGVP